VGSRRREARGPSRRGRIKGVEVWGRGGGQSYFIHLSGPSRVIKLLYALGPPTPHTMGPETSLVGSSPPWSTSGQHMYMNTWVCWCAHVRYYAGMHIRVQ
jgi:hypothetical protein